MSTYDLRVARVIPHGEWVLTDDMYMRTRTSVPGIGGAVDTVSEGVLDLFRTDEGEA